MLSLMLSLSASAQASCEPPLVLPTDFERELRWVGGFDVAIELHAQDSLERLPQVLETLGQAQIPVTIVLPLELAQDNSELLFGAVAAGNELAMQAPASTLLPQPLPRLPEPWLKAIKAQRKGFKRASGAAPTVWSTDQPLPPAGELAVEQSRLSHVLLSSTQATVHRVAKPDGTRGTAMVLPASPVGCEGVFVPTVWALDELSETLARSLELRLPVMRLPLDLQTLQPQELELLLRWVQEQAAPQEVDFVRISQVTPEIPESQAPKGPAPGREITLEQLHAAAAELVAQPAPLPRMSQGFSLTELLLGFCQRAAALPLHVAPPIFLSPLRAPQESARSSWSQAPTAYQVIQAGAELAPRLRAGIPNWVNVGDQLLAARELLWGLAWVLSNPSAGDAVVPLPVIRDPDPSAADLGWGSSLGR